MNRFCFAALAAGLAALPALAHHSFAAEYDSSAAVTLKGTVTKVEWTNPHTYVYIDVKDANGNVVSWGVEGYPPNTLRRTGFTRGLMKEGDVVTINGWKARDAANRIAARDVTFANGNKMFFGPAAQ
ncbi:MAG TPA: DUF6152 family protein [Bryobacteraceae bacterium]|nr:DUF6152 family protein [Bryobacteraceae bacterium]